jgi:hypothetical protein
MNTIDKQRVAAVAMLESLGYTFSIVRRCVRLALAQSPALPLPGFEPPGGAVPPRARNAACAVELREVAGSSWWVLMNFRAVNPI